MTTLDTDPVSLEQGREIGESHNMIPMGMGHKDVYVTFPFTARAGHQFLAYSTNPRTRVKDDGDTVPFNADTSCIAANSSTFKQRMIRFDILLNLCRIGNSGAHNTLRLHTRVYQWYIDNLGPGWQSPVEHH